MKSFKILIWLLLFVTLSGCAELETHQLIKNDDIIIPKRKAIILFVDGVNNDLFQQMLQQGKLPYINKYLVQRGCSFDAALTTVPSITYAVTATFATGRLPSHHGILGNIFFDRNRLIFADYNSIPTYRNIDLDYFVPNIYEILGDKFSVTIQTPLTRGSYHHIANWAESGTCWYFGLYESVDRWTARRFKDIAQLARRVNHWPALIFAYFPATDEIGHRDGPNTPRYRASLEDVDRQVGHICHSLEKSHLLDSTYLVFVSDHGMVQSAPDNNLDIKKLLEEHFDLKIAASGPDQRKSFSQRSKYFRKYNAVLTNGAGRRAVLYLKTGPDWSQPAPPQKITPFADLLVRQPAVDIIAYRQPPGVIVQSSRGQALIERKDSAPVPVNRKQYRYRIIDGKDPLGYDTLTPKNELFDGNYHDGRTWLDATVHTSYPDLPAQIAELFDSPRAGDLVVFAADNWDFDPHIIGGHGGVTPGDMRMPMIFAGPGIPKGTTLNTARTVDLAPTIIEMIAPGRTGQYLFDGESLLPLLK